MFQAVSGIGSVIINWPYLDSVYVRTSYSWKEGHPPSQANFSERLHGKMLTPLCSRMLYAWRKVGTRDTATWMTHLAEPTFSSCEWFAKFCEKMLEKLTRPG